MKQLIRILFFFLLSLSLPVGKLIDIFSWNSSIIKSEIRIDRKAKSNNRACYYKHLVEKIVNRAESAKQCLISKKLSFQHTTKSEMDFHNFQTAFASIKPQIKEHFNKFKLCQDEYMIAA